MSQETLNTIIAVIIIPLAGVLIPMAVDYLNLKRKQIKDKINDDNINKYVDIATNAVQDAVLATYQTFVSKIKDTEGWTEEVQKQALEEAKIKAIAIMGTAAREALQTVYVDFDNWLELKIEAYIGSTK